jgi:hypothetical protein
MVAGRPRRSLWPPRHLPPRIATHQHHAATVNTNRRSRARDVRFCMLAVNVAAMLILSDAQHAPTIASRTRQARDWGRRRLHLGLVVKLRGVGGAAASAGVACYRPGDLPHLFYQIQAHRRCKASRRGYLGRLPGPDYHHHHNLPCQPTVT